MDNGYNSKLVSKIVSLLKSFTPDEPELGVTQLASRSRLPKSTTHRLLNDLVKGNLLSQDSDTSKYAIGPEIYILGSMYLNATDVLKAAKPVMKVLNELTNEAISLSILDHTYARIIMKMDPKYAFRYFVHIGQMLPAYASAMGRALLSEFTDEKIDALFPEEKLLPITKKTITTKTELKRLLQQIRKTGISFNREGAHHGVDGIASIIRDASGKAVAAMAIPVPVFRVNRNRRELLGKLARLGCQVISYRLGYRDTDSGIHDINDLHRWWAQNGGDRITQEIILA